MSEEIDAYDEAATRTVALGNQISDSDSEAHPWDIADGLLAGAVQFWLYTRQPCDDPECEECAGIRTAERRLEELQQLVEELARSSEYFHAPTDFGVGRA